MGQESRPRAPVISASERRANAAGSVNNRSIGYFLMESIPQQEPYRARDVILEAKGASQVA
jgi:hypothetical protein